MEHYSILTGDKTMNIQVLRERYAQWPVEKIFVIIFLAGFILRVILPNLKLLHHDEAIHAWFSYELLTKGIYQYDPMYHGPLLYYLTAALFRLFGDSDLIVRLLPAMFGSAIILLIYGIYKTGWLSGNHAIWAGLFFAFSPDMVYFSRFLRHDIFQLFFTVLLLFAILAYIEFKNPGWALVTGSSAALGMCLKEDMPVAILVFVMFFIFLVYFHHITLPGTWKRDFAYAVLIAAGIGFILYSSLFHHPLMFFEAPFKAIEHWTSMHDQCRLCGPPYWYLLMFLLYEIPLLILAVIGAWQWGWKDKGFSHIRRQEPDSRDDGSIKRSLFMILLLAWTGSTMVFYGWVGEKVPWLLIHQLFPVILLASYKIEGRKVIAGAVTIIFLLVMTMHVCFTPADINEPIVQVQNSEDMREVMAIIDTGDKVAVASDSYWPLPWYYRGGGWDKILFYGKKVDPATWAGDEPDVIITHDIDSYQSLPGYEKREYHLSYWFSWYDNHERVLQWYLLRDGKMGTVNLDVFTKIRHL